MIFTSNAGLMAVEIPNCLSKSFLQKCNMSYDNQMDDLCQLGKLVRDGMEAKNLTRWDLQTATGIDRNYIGEIENGRVKPSPFHLHKLAHVLDLNYAELMSLARHTITN